MCALIRFGAAIERARGTNAAARGANGDASSNGAGGGKNEFATKGYVPTIRFADIGGMDDVLQDVEVNSNENTIRPIDGKC